MCLPISVQVRTPFPALYSSPSVSGGGSTVKPGRGTLFMMIRTAIEDAHGTIELLHEDEADHLVGEGHLA